MNFLIKIKMRNRKMSENCFLCLNKTSNKICQTCNCSAHPACWSKYLKTTTENFIVIQPDGIAMLVKYQQPCPICKSPITQLPATTRSKTKGFRKEMCVLETLAALLLAENTTPVEKGDRFNDVLVKLKNMKSFIKEDPQISRVVQKELARLYYLENWSGANHCHMSIYGRQIRAANHYGI